MTTLSLYTIAIASQKLAGVTNPWGSSGACLVAPLKCWHLSQKVHTWSHLINIIGDLHELVFCGVLVSPILLKLNGISRTRWDPRTPSCAPSLVFQLALIFSSLLWAVIFIWLPPPCPHIHLQLRHGRTWVTFILVSPTTSSVPGTQ